MIQPNQLRIGNWVAFKDWLKGDPLNVRVSGIIGRDKLTPNTQVWYNSEKLVGSTSNLECFKPIPLTEEMLLKCGFEKGNHLTLDIGGDKRLLLTNTHTNYYQVYIQQEDDLISITFDETHLHQLQNLYFALTGKELEIEL